MGRLKRKTPGNVTTEQNAAQLLQAERTDPSRVTRTRANLTGRKGKATPEAFDDLNATNPDAGKALAPSMITAARERARRGPAAGRATQQQRLQELLGEAVATIEQRKNVVASLEARAAEKIIKTATHGAIIDAPALIEADDFGQEFGDRLQQIQDNANQEVIDASLKNLRIEDNILTKFDTMTYNFRLFMTGELATSNTLSTEDIVVIAETGSTGFNITDVDIKTIISPSLLTRNSYATNLKISIIEPHGNSLLDRMKNAASSLEVIDHKDVPLWFSISFKGYTQGENHGENSHDGGIPTGELSEETRTWQIKLRRIEAEINKGGTEYILTAVPLNEQGMGDAARRLEKEIQIDAFDLEEFFKNLSKELNDNENYSTQDSQDITERVRKYGFSLPRGDELNFAKNNNVPQINDMSTWEIRGENIAENKRTETFKDGKRKWRITFGQGTAIEAIIQEIIGTTVEGQSLALYGEKRGNTNDISPNEPREPTKPSIIFTVDPTVDIISYNGVARAYNTLNIYHIRPYLTFQPILSRKQIEDSLEERKSKERFAKQLKVTNIRKKYEYMFAGLNTEVLDYKIKFDRTWFLSLPIFQGQNRNALGISSGVINLNKSSLRIIQKANAVNKASQSLRAKAVEQLTDIESKLSNINDAAQAKALVQEQRELQAELVVIDITASENAQTQVEAIVQAKAVQQQALKSGARKIDTSTFGAGIIRLETDIVDSGGNIALLLGEGGDDRIIISDDERELVNNVRDRIRSNQGTKGSIFFAEDLDRLDQGIIGPDTSKNENQTHNNVATEISPTLHSSESGIEGTASKGRSFFSSVMNQIYGQKGQMRMIEMTIRGDPYWLGEPDVLKRLTVATANSRDITRSDSLIIMTFAFPNGINDGGDNRGDSFEGTGLYNIDRKENGFNGVYYIRQVENKFSNGKFTQKLIGHADILTQESDVINAVINLSNSTGN